MCLRYLRTLDVLCECGVCCVVVCVYVCTHAHLEYGGSVDKYSQGSIHLFKKYLLSTCCVPGTVLGTEDMAMNKTVCLNSNQGDRKLSTRTNIDIMFGGSMFHDK